MEPMTIEDYSKTAQELIAMLFEYIKLNKKEAAQKTIQNISFMLDSLTEIVNEL